MKTVQSAGAAEYTNGCPGYDSKQTWVQVLTHAQGGCVVHRCQKKIPEKGWPVDENDVMHRKGARRILGILKKSVSWVENWTPCVKGRH